MSATTSRFFHVFDPSQDPTPEGAEAVRSEAEALIQDGWIKVYVVRRGRIERGETDREFLRQDLKMAYGTSRIPALSKNATGYLIVEGHQYHLGVGGGVRGWRAEKKE